MPNYSEAVERVRMVLREGLSRGGSDDDWESLAREVVAAVHLTAAGANESPSEAAVAEVRSMLAEKADSTAAGANEGEIKRVREYEQEVGERVLAAGANESGMSLDRRIGHPQDNPVHVPAGESEGKRISKLETALAFAMSMIRSGERMTDTAERIFREALSNPDESSEKCSERACRRGKGHGGPHEYA